MQSINTGLFKDLPDAIKWHKYPEIDYMMKSKGKEYLISCITIILNSQK